MASSGKTYDDLLEEMSPPKFDQRYRVPENAKVIYSPQDRWWRSDSPRPAGRFDKKIQASTEAVAEVTSERKGVFDWNRNEEANTYYQITHTSIYKPPAEMNGERAPTRCIAGYSGFIPGKYSGNIIGAAFTQSKIHADAHLQTTAQAVRFGMKAPQ